jgi:hypothetical protein
MSPVIMPLAYIDRIFSVNSVHHACKVALHEVDEYLKILRGKGDALIPAVLGF